MGWYDINKAVDGRFYFNLKASNAKTILTSEMYTQKQSAKTGISSVQKNSQVSERFDKRTSISDEPYFVLKAENGEIIGNSEMYSSNQARDTGIASVMENGDTETINDNS